MVQKGSEKYPEHDDLETYLKFSQGVMKHESTPYDTRFTLEIKDELNPQKELEMGLDRMSNFFINPKLDYPIEVAK